MIPKKRFIQTGLFVCLVMMIIGFQPGYAKNFQGTLTFNMGFPQEEFQENVDRVALGIQLGGNYRLGHSPFLIGAEIGVMTYGRDKRVEYVSNFPDINSNLGIDVVHDYNMVQGGVYLRFQPQHRGIVKPYLDILAGLNYIYTSTSIPTDYYYDDYYGWGSHSSYHDEYSKTNYDDTSFYYGIGAGFQVPLYRTYPGRRSPGLLLDVRARYTRGGEATYLTKGSIIVDNTKVTYIISKSHTDLIVLQAGVTFSF